MLFYLVLDHSQHINNVAPLRLANLLNTRQVLIIGLPVAVIVILAATVAHERHTKSKEARKRTGHLKRWLNDQGPARPEQ